MRLEGSCFQSWDHFTVEVEGLTAVVGPSNLGKSAIFRSMKAVTRNDLPAGWIKNGTSGASVRFEDGIEVVLTRAAKGTAKYLVGGEKEYRKLGDQVPEELKALGYGMVELGDFKFDPIFASQFDPQFGLSWTPSQINQVLGAFASTEKLEHGKKEINRRIQEANGEAKLIANELAELEAQTVKCEALAVRAEAQDRTLLRLAEGVESGRGRLDATSETLARWLGLGMLRAVADGLHEVPDPTPCSAILVRLDGIDELFGLRSSLEVGTLTLSRLRAEFVDPRPRLERLGDLGDLIATRTDLIHLDRALAELDKNQIEIPDWSRRAEILDLIGILLVPVPGHGDWPDVQGDPCPHLDRLELVQDLLDLATDMSEFRDKLTELEDMESTVSNEITGLLAALAEAERAEALVECPKCGHKFEVE